MLFAQQESGFVRSNGTHFTINGKPYYYIGTNYWYGGLRALKTGGKERLIEELDFLKSKGINNLRVMASAEGEGLINEVKRVSPALQPTRGNFDPEILGGLDYLLYEMQKRKMQAVLYLSNNWEWSGGFLQYLNWNGLIADSTLQRKPQWDELRDQVSQFYFCDACKSDYQKQLEYILSHRNSYSGIRYIDDPTIMSWEVANEPRPMRPASILKYTEWLSSVASLIKSIDTNHLVTLGTEGVIGTENSEQLYESLHSSKTVDYLTIHIWPKNWVWYSDTSISKNLSVILRKTESYIEQHKVIAARVMKPLVIEEFGLPRDLQSYSVNSSTVARDMFYYYIFTHLFNSIHPKTRIAGVNFWAFAGSVKPIAGQTFWKQGDDYMGDPPQEEQGLNAVFDTDSSTWKIISHFTELLNNK